MTKLKHAPVLSRVSSASEIKSLVENDRIASISLRLSTPCNLDCHYCYSNQRYYDNYKDNALSYDEIISTLEQAFSIGVRYVSFAGDGEPLMYRTKEGDVFSLIDFINSQNAEVFLFTNQTLITPKTAGILFNKNVTVIGKQNTLDPEKQAKFFCKTPNAQERLSEGLENLINAGFNKVHPSRLALHSVILSANYDELPKMWRQWRRQNIIPYVQVTVPPPDPQSQRAFFENDYVAPDKLRKLFESFLKIDETEFGYTWDVVKTYPIPVMGCSVALSGCGITPTGDVQICSYTESSLGNVKRESLIDIMKSEEVRKIRRYKYEEMNSGNLYGCRCIAFALKDRYSIDPIFKEFEHSTH